MKFEHLHTHSQHSLLDGLSPVRGLCEMALEQGQETITITDHGTLAGIPELFRMAGEYGLKPIAGMEAYFARDAKLHDKTSTNYHLTLIAKNLEGYKNLCKLVTLSYKEGFYKKPRIDLEMLSGCRKGIVVLSGCMGSLISQSVLENKHAFAEDLAVEFNEIFENFYLEYMDHSIPEQKVINMAFDSWRRKHKKLRGVVTQDSHYLHEEDAQVHQTMLCVGTHSTIKDPAFKFSGGPYNYCTTEHLLSKFDAKLISNSYEIASMCEKYDIPRTGCMPDIPKHILKGMKPLLKLEEMAWAGLKKRKLKKKLYVDRLREELTVVHSLGFDAYFIIISDVLLWARNNSILVGPGRGSSAGSLLAYVLEITDMDPIRYGLYFERFLNKDRVNPPDIDVDIADTGRQRVLGYIRETYGEGHVAHIGSFNTMGPRQSLKDVGSAHGMPFPLVESGLKLIPHDPMIKFEDVEALHAIKAAFPKDVINEARTLCGKPRNMTIHSAGVVIANHDLSNHLPLVLRNDLVQTMYSMDDMAKLGYTKFDILGLKTLGIMDAVIKSAGIIRAKLSEMKTPDNEEVYDMLCNGHTTGVFQLESWGCTQMVKRYQPRNFEDIMMINALYRPGPMQGGEGLEIIIRRRNQEEQVVYKHPSLEQILRNTYGMPVFQEQVMRMCQTLAGFSLSQADAMRSAIGKKDEVKMEAFKHAFTIGCVERGITNALADEFWSDITFFNRYGWNRAHAAAYGALTYYTAWLKVFYKEHYMAALINAESDKERTARLISECHRRHIEFKKVDINKSQIGYTVTQDNELLSGLGNIKGIGEKASEAILNERKRGQFSTIEDFRKRVPPRSVNKLGLEKLNKAGAFSGLSLDKSLYEIPF